MRSAAALGLALGIACGLYMLLIGLAAAYLNWGRELVDVVGSLYIGYKATLAGSFIGLGWAFIDGFIGGFIIAWLYNWLAGKKEAEKAG